MQNPFELYNAKWIGEDSNNHNHAPMLMQRFNIAEKCENITLYITGLGLFEVFINGKKVSDVYFAPGESNYGRRVYYEKYHISNLVSMGENEICILLGSGQYANFKVNPTMEKDGELTEPHRYQKNDGMILHEGIYGEKKAIAVIEQAGKVLCVTDESWMSAKSNITFQSWYGGEDFDATKEIIFNKKAKIKDAPTDILTQRFFSPIREIERLKPFSITKNGDSYIVDFGKNGAGVPHVKLDTTEKMRGVKIKMLPCEELTENGFADQRSSTQSWSETKKCEISDSYTIAGTGVEEWHPVFCYHGFRYLEVQGMPYEPTKDTFTYIRLMADNPKNGSFETDNTLLQRINDMTDRSIESNMFFSFTDCPQIEKLGWLETSHLMFKSMAYHRDIEKWIVKIARDMADSILPDGYMPAIVPPFQLIHGLERDVNWGGACIMTPWYFCEFFGDTTPIEICLDAGGKYIECMKGYMKDGILQSYSQMGDWGQINENTPTILVENCAFYLLLKTYGKSLEALGKDGKYYMSMAERVKKAFHENEVCYNKETGVYGNGSQASYGCVLFSGIYLKENEEGSVKGLVEAVKRADYHLTSGEVGLKQVFASLNKYGYDDLVYKMVTNPTQPSYRYFADKNLTTLPEYWNYEELWWGMVRSRNHAMMGHVKEWLVQGVLGVRYEKIDNITVKPYVPENTTWAKGWFHCGLGKVEVNWHVRGEKKIEITARVPKGVTVRVCAPDGYELIPQRE